MALVLIAGGLAACAGKPTEEECKAAIKRMMEIQVDEMAKALPAGEMGKGPNGESAQDMLKAGLSSVITPAAVKQCTERVKKADTECTMTASNTDDLINKCHWKVLPGGKLGF